MILIYVLIDISKIVRVDWQEILINNERHTPIAGEGQPTIIILSVIGIVGYFVLKFGLFKFSNSLQLISI